MKKLPLKIAHNWPPSFFFSTGPTAQRAQKPKILYAQEHPIEGLGIQTGLQYNLRPISHHCSRTLSNRLGPKTALHLYF